MFPSVFTDELHVEFMEALDTLASWGLKYVDLRSGVLGKDVDALSAEELGKVKAALGERGLAVGALESSLAKVHLPGPEVRAREEEKLEGIIRAADALECRLVRAFFYWQPGPEDAGQLAGRPDDLRLVLEAFAPIAERAKAAGLVLAFENCGVSTEEITAVLKALGEPRWGLAWDVANEWFTSKEAREDREGYVDALAQHTRLVHVKAQGAAPALGETIPYDEILQALSVHGLKGPVSVETHNPDPNTTSIDQSRATLEAVRRVWPSAAPGMAKKPEDASKQVVRDYEPVRFVVVGLGMGRIRAKEIQKTPGTELVGVCDINEERARMTGEELGVPYSTDLREWLERPEVEVVHVLTESGNHGKVAVQALEAGKHVLTTKPMDVSLEACDRMIRAAEQRDLLLAVDLEMRFHSGLLSLRKLVQEGRLGRVLGAQISLKVQRTMEYFHSNNGWRGTIALDGGGVMSNQCVHHIDQARYVLGVPEEVRCDIWTQNHEIEGEDLASALWRYPDGTVVNLFATTCYPQDTWYFQIDIYGMQGAVSQAVGGPFQQAMERYFVDGVWVDDLPEREVSPWLNAMDNFADALRTSAPLVCSGRDGRRTQSLLAAMYESGRGNKGWVKVRPEVP